MHWIEAELQSLLDHAAKTQGIIRNACDAQSGDSSLGDADLISSYVQRIKPMHDETFARLLECRNSRRHHWLGKDDVLHLIFQQSCSADTKGSNAMAISHVCRRFRQVALDTPTLWSHLFSTDPLSKTAEFLHRTKSAGLTVVVDDSYPYDEECLRAFFALLAPFCDRWVEFRYSPSDDDDGYALSNLKLLKEVTSKLKLPRLHRLDIYCGPNEAEDLRLGQDSSICSDWYIPVLRELSCCCVQPDLGLFKGISRLTLRLHLYSPAVRSSILLKSLAALPHLLFLELYLIDIMGSSSLITVSELASVKELHIAVEEVGYSESLRNFYSAFRLPSLSKLLLVIRANEDPMEFQKLFSCIAFNPVQCPYLETLHIHDTGEVYVHDGVASPSFLLDTVFRSFPTIRHFSMNIIGLSVSYRGERVPKNLVTCSLTCYGFPQDRLEHLINSLKATPRYAEFKSLRISSYQPRGLSRNFRDARLKQIPHIALDGKLTLESNPINPPHWAEGFIDDCINI